MFWNVLCSTNVSGTCHKQTKLWQETTGFSFEYSSLCAACILLHFKCRGIMLLFVQCNSLWEVWIVCFHLQDFVCWDKTESLWCYYCLHCELKMLHISQSRLWGCNWPVQFWGAETCATKYLSVKISYNKSVSYHRQMSFWLTATKVAIVLKVKLLQQWLTTL